MADNTTLNAGSAGDVHRSKDRAGVKTDITLLDVGGAAGEAILGDAGARVPTTPLGAVVTMTSASLTIVTTSYTSADQMGTVMTGASAANASGGRGLILGAFATCDAGATPAFPHDLYLFNATVTAAADNAAAAWSDADMQKCVGVVQFPNFTFAGAANGFAQAYLPTPMAYNCAATSLFGCSVARGAIAVFTAATDLKYQLTVAYL